MTNKYQIGATVFGDWIIKRKIGEGSFGQVLEIQREDFGQVYRAALKVITVPQSEAELRGALEEGMPPSQVEQYFYSVVEDIVREFAIMARLKGTANVVSYEDHKVIRHTDSIGWDILIRMELLNPLLSYAYQYPFSRRDIIKLGIDMCRALELCQKYNIIHRDIKPENIFVSDNGDFKLGDFGIARTVEKTVSGLSKKGTYNYMAPEVYRGENYGFDVDIYSLGIVLYRLLNKNRTPFLPPAPEAITYHKREEALTRRVSGETVPKPIHAEGRLAEIVLKACAFEPKDRYSSPAQMRQELEAILYSQEEAELIYPDGDELALLANEYASKTPPKAAEPSVTPEVEQTDGTQSMFSGSNSYHGRDYDSSRTESMFHGSRDRVIGENEDHTESIFGKATPHGKAAAARPVQKTKSQKRNRKPAIIAVVAILILLAGGGVFFVQSQRQQEAEKLAAYQQLMQQGTDACATDPTQAAQMFLDAQNLFPEETAPYTSYAYALYCAQEFDDCISYIEDDLALGKNYDVVTQSKLSEILGAAYFEKDDYAAAASFFRLSTAGGDITVSAMRDFAVSLGRLGDVEAADEVLQKMYAAGAESDVTDYVQAEVNYALENYVDAEDGFLGVLNATDDIVLQKRALRSLGEVYRDCAALARTNSSPISYPATKAAELLSDGIVTYGLRYDSTLWEMLALAYFESYHTDASVGENYLVKAAECFNRVIELGVSKDYLYRNLYTIYYELKDYESAEESLLRYEEAFPNDYMPHALRAMMLITIENEKVQSVRNYKKVVSEYEIAGNMIRSSDDATYYQQLESLINRLKAEGWI